MYVSVTLTKNGAAALDYARGSGHGHNGHSERNLMATPINLVPNKHDDYVSQPQSGRSDK